MEQILIRKPNGDTEPINSSSKVSIITQAEHRKTLLGEDTISMTVESAEPRNFGIGDTINIFGLPTYRINQLPKVTKLSERKYQYELVFEGLQYDMLRVAYRNTDVGSFNNAADFSLIGDLEMFLNVLINNLNRVFGANKWALGSFPTNTETKNLLFNSENCLAVLQKLCEEYKYEFVCTETETQKILHIRNVGRELDFNFKYGQGRGLYQLTRENVDTKNIVNTLWAYGSDKNLPANYKDYSPRLRLGNTIDFPILETGSIATYGTFEGTIIFEDIYPHRVGSVTDINEENRLQFTDINLDFDLNAKDDEKSLYLIQGNNPKIRFQTGNLAGYEFEAIKYTHADRTFTLKLNKDEKGMEMPSSNETAFQIQVGDTYVMVDIMMPQAYINVAEDKLASKAIEYLDNNSTPTLKYNLQLDEFYLKKIATAESNIFEVGDTVNIEDTALSINTRIKITEFTRDILKPNKYSLTIQDVPLNTILKKVLVQQRRYNEVIKKKKLDDNFRPPTDWKVVPTIIDIIDEVNADFNEKGELEFGRESEKVTIGNSGSKTSFFGMLGIINPLEKELKLDVGGITQDRQVGFPDRDIVVNDWNYIVGMPESFPSLTSDYGLSGIQNEINKVFTTSEPFVSGSTIVYVNGVRQFRGTNEDYTETADNEITFALAPYADDRIIVDYQKL